MKKMITLSLVSVFGTLVLIGCSAGNTPSVGNVENANKTCISKNLTHEKVHDIIVKAGEENGWKMTEFKTNSVIAEKTVNENSTAVTVTFDESTFELNPANSELQSILEKALD
ncbi:hypothetical protein [Sulfurimonas sp. HSL-1716]|uniref:hypothetical protein n=1 Tax=Hydrocurvibacter sulfurireducens TaxID=3131937 RepID=UPI0031F892CB